MSLKTLIKSIGHFFERLFKNTADDFDNLPADQKASIVDGINVSEIIKLLYKNGEQQVIEGVMQRLHVSENVAIGVVDYALKSWGINETTIQDGLDELDLILSNGITDGGWNSLWKTLAENAAMWISNGKLNWVALSLGLLEVAYQKIFKKVS